MLASVTIYLFIFVKVLMKTGSNLKFVISEILTSHITSRKLTGTENYLLWKKVVQMCLPARDKQSHLFINPPNSGETGSEEWVLRDV